MKRVLPIIALLALCGCDPTPEQEAKMKAALPAGCSIQDLGRYGNVSDVVVVWCNGRVTRTESYEISHGKTHDNIVSAQID